MDPVERAATLVTVGGEGYVRGTQGPGGRSLVVHGGLVKQKVQGQGRAVRGPLSTARGHVQLLFAPVCQWLSGSGLEGWAGTR